MLTKVKHYLFTEEWEVKVNEKSHLEPLTLFMTVSEHNTPDLIELLAGL